MITFSQANKVNLVLDDYSFVTFHFLQLGIITPQRPMVFEGDSALKIIVAQE